MSEGKKSVRKLPGAPPDDELSIRLSYSRIYKPHPEGYKDAEHPHGYRTMLGYLLYDKECLDEGWYALDEAIDLESKDLVVTIELVDTDGNVWSEEYEVENA